MEMLSERYGWTPNEIREQPIADVLAYVEIIVAKKKEEAKLRKKHNGK